MSPIVHINAAELHKAVYVAHSLGLIVQLPGSNGPAVRSASRLDAGKAVRGLENV